MTSVDADQLATRFREREAMIGIIGMGYVGLPLMLACTRAGVRVIGFDIDEPKVGALNHGKSPLKHIGDEKVAAARKAELFEATDDFSRLREPDAILICVPTPLGEHREPDLSYVENTTRAIAERLRPGQLVLESTTYPGTTREVVKPIL
jgi:UDP-N-acetyl-D-glucosamine dehydrogenase